jgi:hypothetical protein
MAMVRASSWILVLGCSLASGCAAFLDYDALTKGRGPDGGGAQPAPPDGSAADASGATGPDSSGDATGGEPRSDGAPSDGAPGDGAPEAASVESTKDASSGGGVDAQVDARGPTEAGATMDARPDPCANVQSIADGAFCGNDGQFGFDSTVTDPNTLYTCAGGRTTATMVCLHGCTVQTFTDDSCNP